MQEKEYEEVTPSAEYIKAFNDGYILAKFDPNFPFDSIPKEGNSDRIQGLQRGIMQYKVDKKMDHLIPSYGITKNIPRKSHSKDKGIDKDDISLE